MAADDAGDGVVVAEDDAVDADDTDEMERGELLPSFNNASELSADEDEADGVDGAEEIGVDAEDDGDDDENETEIDGGGELMESSSGVVGVDRECDSATDDTDESNDVDDDSECSFEVLPAASHTDMTRCRFRDESGVPTPPSSTLSASLSPSTPSPESESSCFPSKPTRLT